MTRYEHTTADVAEYQHPAPEGYRWVTTLAADACYYCRHGIDVGHDHMECCAAELQPIPTVPAY